MCELLFPYFLYVYIYIYIYISIYIYIYIYIIYINIFIYINICVCVCLCYFIKHIALFLQCVFAVWITVELELKPCSLSHTPCSTVQKWKLLREFLLDHSLYSVPLQTVLLT